ncbi:LysM peptidoglycan-binding domain-containing M23 family metallopeptidase [Streptomyces sp. NPDC047000]|uniref:M23 family metallopeptidase n=1 Tax=Streptomyces sp. NPDC047000 TaxID=3155474 RepID=UPI0033E90931
MPAKGKHRRPRAQRLTRSIAAAGTGGAALALPLIGAPGAHAATAQPAAETVSRPVSVKTVQAAPVTVHRAGTVTAATGARVTTYTVRTGDCLAKIAAEHQVRGGWHDLYQANRAAVGGDPSLIHPGLKLTLGGQAAAGTAGSRTAPARPSSPSSSSAASSSAGTASAAKAAAPAAAGFTLPVSGAGVGTSYHVAGSMWSSGYHTGVDFVVGTGTPLKAVGAGTVVSAGWGGAYGNQVVLRLADGYYAQYAHLSSLSVSAGQSVTAGQQVGLSGATGNVTGPHLHFEIRTTPDYGSDVDPVSYLRSHGVAVG